MEICSVCGRECEEVEPGFSMPDAFFAVPKEERPARVKDAGDFVSVDDQAFFMRCVVPIPVEGRPLPYCWGFWAKVARSDFDRCERSFGVDPPADQPGFPGTLANQTHLLPPTLGMPVYVHLASGAERPRLVLRDERHPLTRRQERGVTEAEAHAWSEACASAVPLRSRVEPSVPCFSPTLDRQGWQLAEPRQVGCKARRLRVPPEAGDLVKAPFVFLAADAHGEVTRRVEFMWVLLDEVGADGWWSGTLEDNPFVPGPLGGGTRVWLRARHVAGYHRS